MQRCLFGQITRRNIGNSCFFFFVLSVPFSILCCDKTVLIVRLGMVKKRNLVRVRKISRFGLNDLFSSSFGRHKHSWRSWGLAENTHWRCPNFRSKIFSSCCHANGWRSSPLKHPVLWRLYTLKRHRPLSKYSVVSQSWMWKCSVELQTRKCQKI